MIEPTGPRWLLVAAYYDNNSPFAQRQERPFLVSGDTELKARIKLKAHLESRGYAHVSIDKERYTL